jgi:hypothetical protein
MDWRDRARAVGNWFESFDSATMTAIVADEVTEERLGSMAEDHDGDGSPADPAADIEGANGRTPREDAGAIRCRYIVCSTCDGRGSHVNPSIDSEGLTASDFEEAGEDFREEYCSGRYDVPCYECGGQRVVPWPVEEADAVRVRNILDARAASIEEDHYALRMGC